LELSCELCSIMFELSFLATFVFYPTSKIFHF